MASVVSMPKIGMSVESCVITEWLKKTGDTVAVGDILFTYETDKSSLECESTEAGELLEIFYQEFDDVPVLAPVCAIGTAGEDISGLRPQLENDASREAQSAAGQPTQALGGTPANPSAAQNITAVDHQPKPSPRARHLAERQHVDLRYAPPSGPYGRIIERDVQQLIDSGVGIMTSAAAVSGNAPNAAGSGIGGRTGVADMAAPPGAAASVPEANAGYKDIKMSGIRRTIAKNMEQSLFGIPQLTHHFSFDATAIRTYRAALKAQSDAPNITLGDMVLFAVSRVIKRYPEINAHLINGETLRCFEDVNLGFAADTPRGLLVPVIQQADKKSLPEIAAETKRLAKLAQDNMLGIDEMSGGTFTVSNLGTFGVESFTPVINPPQVGILGVCTITNRVKMDDNAIKIYPAMGISFTYDHRAFDGAPASRFAGELCRALENFQELWEGREE